MVWNREQGITQSSSQEEEINLDNTIEKLCLEINNLISVEFLTKIANYYAENVNCIDSINRDPTFDGEVEKIIQELRLVIWMVKNVKDCYVGILTESTVNDEEFSSYLFVLDQILKGLLENPQEFYEKYRYNSRQLFDDIINKVFPENE